MSGKKQWGLHGYVINDYKDKLEAALTHVPADNGRCRGHINRVIDVCVGFLKAEGLHGDNLIDKKSQEVVEQWIDGLILNFPELKPLIRG